MYSNDKFFDAFYDSVLKKKKAINRNIGYPILKRKTQAPGWYSAGKAPDQHQTPPRATYRRVYFEALNLVISRIK